MILTMTQEQKELLLKDLCARLLYGVKINNMGKPSILTSINNKYRIIVETAKVEKNLSFNLRGLDVLEIEDAKPYLFPLSSMTEEQKNEYDKIIYRSIELHHREYSDIVEIDLFDDLQDFYHKNHLDYRGLIPMDLAIDATGKNIY